MKNLIAIFLVLLSLNATAKIPADLKHLMKAFNELVSEGLGELVFTQEILKSKNEWGGIEIAPVITELVERYKHSQIENLDVRTIYNYNRTPSQMRNTLVKEILWKKGTMTPYFCGNFRELENEDIWTTAGDKRCRHLTYRVLSGIFSLLPITYVFDIEGDWYGNFREVIFIVQSKENSKYALKYTFDIIHEI